LASTSRRSNPERRGESQEKILGAAEALFAKRGFNGVSLKDIAEAADVDQGLLHYYFATKAGLFQAVIARRADLINDARRASMRAYAEGAGDALTVEGALRAYLEPTFEFVRQGGQSQRDYLTLVAQLNSSPAGSIPGAEITPFDPVVQEFIALLRRASPQSSEAELYWFYHMLSGAITLCWAQTGRIDNLSAGACRSDDYPAMAEQMMRIFAHGLPDRETKRPS
jgi:AcrR family transcriptional regulator